jgi:hypothetical protein
VRCVGCPRRWPTAWQSKIAAWSALAAFARLQRPDVRNDKQPGLTFGGIGDVIETRRITEARSERSDRPDSDSTAHR